MPSDVNIFEYLDYRKFLTDLIEFKKASNPHYSLRSVAHRLNCNPGFFNRILKGTRNLSQEHILKLGEILKLNNRQQHYFELVVQYNQAKKQAEKDHYFERLDMFRTSKVKEISTAQYAMYSHWYYVVLRELLHIVPCQNDSEDTCRVLARHIEPRVPPAQIREALEVLERLGFLTRSRNGTYALKERFITSGSEIPQVVINRVLMEFMDRAREAIDRFPRQERNLSTLTFSVSGNGLEKIRDKLDQTRREVLAIVNDEKETVDRVYHLNMHLFPVSKPCKGGK